MDRAVRDLQSQLERRDRQNAQLSDEIGQKCDKVERLLATIDELQADESRTQLAARRAERDLREEREERLRLERELEGWKSLRVERTGISGSVSATRLGAGAGEEERRASGPLAHSARLGKANGENLKRQMSTSKVLL